MIRCILYWVLISFDKVWKRLSALFILVFDSYIKIRDNDVMVRYIWYRSVVYYNCVICTED